MRPKLRIRNLNKNSQLKRVSQLNVYTFETEYSTTIHVFW